MGVAVVAGMKKLLWLAGAVGVLAAVGVATAAVLHTRRKQLGQPRLALAGMLGFGSELELSEGDIYDAEIIQEDIIELVPLDVMSGPLAVDDATQAMLAQLADRAMFLK